MNIHLFGNCQTAALRKLILEDHPDWTVSVTELGSARDAAPEAVANHRARLADADIVIAQPVTAWKGIEEFSLPAVEALRKSGSELLTFPSIVFEGTHPSFTYLGRRLDGFGMPYHNAHALDMFLRGYRRDDIGLLLGAADFYPPEFTHVGIEASLAVLRHREAIHAVTVRASDLIEDAGRSRLLMNTMNHPRRLLLVRVLNRFYEAMSMTPVAREAGADYLSEPFIPPLPAVLHHLGIPDDEPRFLVAHGRYTRDAYLRASLAYYDRLLPADLLSALVGSRAETFLKAFGSVGPYPDPQPGTFSGTAREQAGQWVENLYSVFLERLPSNEELSTHLEGLHRVGVHTWLAHFADASEVIARFRSRVG